MTPPFEIKEADPRNMIPAADRLGSYVTGNRADDVLRLLVKLEQVTQGNGKLWHVTADGRLRNLSNSKLSNRTYAELRLQRDTEALEALCAPLFSDDCRATFARAVPHIWLRQGSKPPKLGMVHRLMHGDTRRYYAAVSAQVPFNRFECPQGVGYVNMWLRLLRGIATKDVTLRPQRDDAPRLRELKKQVLESCSRGRAARLLSSMEAAIALGNFS